MASILSAISNWRRIRAWNIRVLWGQRHLCLKHGTWFSVEIGLAVFACVKTVFVTLATLCCPLAKFEHKNVVFFEGLVGSLVGVNWRTIRRDDLVQGIAYDKSGLCCWTVEPGGYCYEHKSKRIELPCHCYSCVFLDVWLPLPFFLYLKMPMMRRRLREKCNMGRVYLHSLKGDSA